MVRLTQYQYDELTAGDKQSSLQKTGKNRKKATGQKEAEIQDYVEQYLNLKGIRFLRIPDAVYRACGLPGLQPADRQAISEYLKGVPDLIIFKREFINNTPTVDNSALMIELKRKGEVQRGSQRAWAKGLSVNTCDSFDDARILIDKWLET